MLLMARPKQIEAQNNLTSPLCRQGYKRAVFGMLPMARLFVFICAFGELGAEEKLDERSTSVIFSEGRKDAMQSAPNLKKNSASNSAL
jgi:hypothetical protein